MGIQNDDDGRKIYTFGRPLRNGILVANMVPVEIYGSKLDIDITLDTELILRLWEGTI